ncbi:hypothetical protein LCGC14_1747130 [marine sediment metagenome]|uniref:Transcriptional regulator n=1 Tax=marine sediment metagenome TaxID=412755 RepID=A0A0F9K4D3_9ZZZZ
MKTTQKVRLKALFESRPGQWISLREIMDMRIGQYNSRLLDLRRSGMNITNKCKIIDGRQHSCYLYTPQEKQAEMFKP